MTTVRPHGAETILLVEDEAMLRRLAGRGLARYGYTVLEAGSAEEALTMLDAHVQDVSLIVTDLTLPGSEPATEVGENGTRAAIACPILEIEAASRLRGG